VNHAPGIAIPAEYFRSTADILSVRGGEDPGHSPVDDDDDEEEEEGKVKYYHENLV
jgi:hypothetical protein